MLVLTRKTGEAINIGGEITVRIMEVSGRTVRIGVEAPKSTPIHREEIYSKIQEENIAASGWKEIELSGMDRLMKTLHGRKK